MNSLPSSLSILVLEDDIEISNKIANYTKTLDDVSLIGITAHSSEADSLIRTHHPDAVILDLELHAGSGSGLELLQSLRTNPPSPLPYIVVTTNNSSKITLDAARSLGADYIFSKHQEDFSEKTPIDFLLMLRGALQKPKQNIASSSSPTQHTHSESVAQTQLTEQIVTEMNLVCISPKAIGYRYLISAIRIAIENPGVNPASVLSEQYNKSKESIERAMQNAINRTWATTPIDTLSANYTARVNSKKGAPTLTEFIYYYVSKLKTLSNC